MTRRSAPLAAMALALVLTPPSPDLSAGGARAQGRSAAEIETDRAAPTALAATQAAPVDPVLRVEFETTEAAAGQPLDLRITALVPTFMPRPPDWPGLEAPDLLARPPARAAHPVSETVDGETWSGVSRRWRLIPIADKAFALTGRTVRVAWSDPESGAAKTADLALPPLEFRGVRPKGTKDMDPFLAARRLTLTRTVERIAAGAAGTAGEGDAAGDDVGKTGAGEAEPTPRPQPPATASSSPSSPRRRGCRPCSCPCSPRSRSSTASPPIRTRPGWPKPTAAQAVAGRGRSGWR